MGGSARAKFTVVLVGVLLAGGILAQDLLRPLGVAGGVPYIAVVLISWWLPNRRAAIVLGIVCTFLTVLGFVFSPRVGPLWEIAASRFLAIFAIWMVTLLCLQHKRSEEALRESEELFSLFMRYLPGLAMMKDEHQRITYLNETFEETFGISRGEWIGHTVEDVFPNKTATQLKKNDEWVLGHDKALKVTEKVEQTDGVHHYLTYRFPIHRPGRPAILGGVSIDLTERIRAEEALQRAHSELEHKVEERTADLVAANARLEDQIAERRKTERALRASEQLYAQAQQIAHLGHWERDFRFGEDRWSEETYRIFGLPQQAPDSEPAQLLQMVHADDKRAVRAAIITAERQGLAMDMDYRIVRPDGAERVVHTMAEVRRDETGKPATLVGTVQDITERREAEKRIQRQQEELAHLSRLSTLGEMATGLAHELNQPLASIVSYTQGCIRRIEQGSTKSAELVVALRKVSSEADRAGEIIRRIRRFIRKREPQRAPIKPGELIEQVLELVRHELQAEGVALEVNVAQRLPRIHVDRIQLQQVVLNLLRNSMEAMAGCDQERRTIWITVDMPDEHSVEFALRDTGSGLPADGTDKVFDPFYTTKAEGTGMGLAISRTIIEAHGGRLWAQGNPDGGSTFGFSLPA